MDANLIYRKTPSGEEAVRQRTRVVQRNTRMVLILVDGKSTVADLCDKTGNPQLVENALQDLERDGLVAVQLNEDSAWEQSRKVAEDIKAAALQRLAAEGGGTEVAAPPAPLPEVEAPPMSSPSLSPQSVSPQSMSPPSVSPQSISLQSIEPFSEAPISLSPPSGFPLPASVAPNSAFPPESPEPAAAESPAPRDEPVAGGLVGRLSGVLARGADDDAIKPIRRGPRTYVSLPLAAALGVLGLVVLVVLVFVLYPYDRHRPQLEAGLGRLLGQPVQIREVQASFSPRPAISLEAVSVGDGSKATAARIRLHPELLSLLGSHPSFSSVEIVSASFDGDAMAMLPKALTLAAQPDAPAQIHALSFSRLHLSLLDLSLDDLQGEVLPAELAKGKGFSLHNADRSLRVQLNTEGKGIAADFEGYGWQPVADSPFRFNSIQGRAIWDGRALSVRSLDARIFDGAVQGALTFEQATRPKLTGDLGVKHMNLARLAGALGYPEQFEGEFAGALKFTASAAEWGEVLKAATGEGEFAMQRGALGNIDLVEAVRRTGKGGVAGGSTHFEQLSSRILITPESVRFAGIALASGALRSGGTLDVARDGKLSGRFDVEMRGSASVIRTPVNASGSLKAPTLQAGR